MVIQIPTNIVEVDKIFHIADVHLRNHLRHEEYEAVFEKLYSYIKNHKTDNSLIYLAGDIVHAKTDISPELVSVLSKFLYNLAELCTTLAILGNHDMNLKNNSRLNIIKPIVELLKHPNLHLLDKNGYYQFAQLGISVFEIATPFSEYLPASGLKSPVKIALYHGPLNGVSTESGLAINDSHLPLDAFKGFDLALLGDIHKRQILQYRNEDYLEIDETELQLYLDKGWELV